MAREWRSRVRAVPRSLWTAMAALALAAVLSFPLQPAADDDAALMSPAAGRALAAFAIARAINGIVSVAQSSEVGATFVVSGSVGVGQILDPINDLIERFSVAALFAATALIALQLIKAIVVAPLVPAVALALALLAVLLALLLPRPGGRTLQAVATVFARITLAVWLFAVLTPWAVDAVHRSDVVQSRYNHAQAEMAQVREDLEIVKDLATRRVSFEEFQRRVDVAALAERLSTQAVTVLAVFALEAILLPLLAFWLGLKAVQAAVPRAGASTAAGHAAV